MKMSAQLTTGRLSRLKSGFRSGLGLDTAHVLWASGPEKKTCDWGPARREESALTADVCVDVWYAFRNVETIK